MLIEPALPPPHDENTGVGTTIGTISATDENPDDEDSGNENPDDENPGDENPDEKPDKMYAVSHVVALQGIDAPTFNGDPNMILAFQETISESLGLALSAVVNIIADTLQNRPEKTAEQKLNEMSCA